MMKTCSKCKIEKSHADFSGLARAKDGLQGRCKLCSNALAADYRASNSSKIKASAAQDYVRHQQAYKARAAGRYDKCKDAVKRANAAYQAAHPDRRSVWDRKYSAANLKKGRANAAKRKAAKLQATPAWASKPAIQKFYDTADAVSMHTGVYYHVDHVVPLQGKTVCGLHCEANLQILSASENTSKSNRHWPDMP